MLFKWLSHLFHTISFTLLFGTTIQVIAITSVQASPITNVFINEIHYDNSGADQGEFVELAGIAGLNLAGWALHFYNGSNGNVYKKHTFTDWTFNDTSNGFGFAGVKVSGIQNGAPDGIALADDLGNIVQFLSYEGQFVASSGIALGLSSTDIGVSESANTVDDFSLQLTGQGNKYSDFTWASSQNSTFNTVNYLQNITHNKVDPVKVTEPSSQILFISAFLLVAFTSFAKFRVSR